MYALLVSDEERQHRVRLEDERLGLEDQLQQTQQAVVNWRTRAEAVSSELEAIRQGGTATGSTATGSTAMGGMGDTAMGGLGDPGEEVSLEAFGRFYEVAKSNQFGDAHTVFQSCVSLCRYPIQGGPGEGSRRLGVFVFGVGVGIQAGDRIAWVGDGGEGDSRWARFRFARVGWGWGAAGGGR